MWFTKSQASRRSIINGRNRTAEGLGAELKEEEGELKGQVSVSGQGTAKRVSWWFVNDRHRRTRLTLPSGRRKKKIPKTVPETRHTKTAGCQRTDPK